MLNKSLEGIFKYIYSRKERFTLTYAMIFLSVCSIMWNVNKRIFTDTVFIKKKIIKSLGSKIIMFLILECDFTITFFQNKFVL